ncbi:MAG: class I SAM-dependent methyltransferase [Candidatus Pacearchaeota archaeon]|nr:class I SAM-dependent methyltransferase [Candidatus Pacearchaeota archaeon]
MSEFNLLESAGLPQKKKRDREGVITQEDREIAGKLAFDFYDGDRRYGYGGYIYDGRWKKVAESAKERYKLNPNSKVLIDRCHKGFLVHDLKQLIPEITVYGMHPKEYAINHAMEGFGRWFLLNSKERNEDPRIDIDPRLIEEKARDETSPFLIQADSREMPFGDNYFDCVISIENACSFPEEECRQIVREIVRVSKLSSHHCYIQNDSWENEEQKKKLLNWSKLCKTFLDMDQWKKLYEEEYYHGDFGFTIIE